MTAPEPPLGEFARIARFLAPLAAGCPGAFGLTDDAAVLAVPAGQQLVVTTDAMVADVHFLADDPPADIAAKLLRTNLSDLAAMGAAPFGYSLVLSLPRTQSQDWLAGFAAGLAADQEQYGISLIGGDCVSTRGPVTLAISALGLVPAGQALRRRVAGPVCRQALFVTGTIGDAALGLKFVLGDLDAAAAPAADRAALIARLRRPEPRLAAGQALRAIASAALDVSDGLIADLGHLCEVSGCAAVIAAARVPLSEPARALLARRPELLETVLTGGDDYELAFAAPAAARPALGALAAGLGVAITEIGHLETGPAGRVEVRDAAGSPLALAGRGWSHFPGS
ncbi:MAG: thiamine-phosphate kinase [Rhodospirillaceae bacterium]